MRIELVKRPQHSALYSALSPFIALALTLVAGAVIFTALGNLLIQARTMGDLPRGSSLRDVAARSSEPAYYRPTLSSP